MYSETLRQLYLEAPAGSCEAAALATLVGLASDQDASAIAALAQLITFELGGDAELAQFAAVTDAASLLGCLEVPLFARLLALGATPRLFLANVEAVALSMHALDTVRDDSPELLALQRLVLRNSFLQHQVLKAMALGLAAGIFSNPMGRGITAGGKLAIVDKIMANCQVVAGANATSDLEIGREMILGASRLESLFAPIRHEFGHLVIKAPQAPETGWTYSTSEDIEQLVTALPKLRQAAVAAKGGAPVGAAGEPQITLPSGISLLYSFDHSLLGSATRLSLTCRGGPVELAVASQMILALLEALGVDPAVAYAAYSPRGVFHCGFEGEPPAQASALPAPTVQGWKSDLAPRAADWLQKLREHGRLGEAERELTEWLHLQEASTRFYGLNFKASSYDHERRAVASTHDLTKLNDVAMQSIVQLTVRCGDAHTLEKVLQAGAPVSAAQPGMLGYTLCVVGQSGKREYAGPNPTGVLDVLHVLHAAGCDLNEPLDEDGRTFMHQAALRSPALLRFLFQHGASAATVLKDGSTPLHIAARFGSIATLQVLTEHADQGMLAARNVQGETPLMAAVQHGDEAMVKHLLERGADAGAADARGRTALMAARSPVLVRLLGAAGADANAALPGGDTALMLAAGDGRPDVVEALLAAGADPQASRADGVTALHYCLGWFEDGQRERCVDLLLAAGAEIDEPLRDGRTLLMVVAARGQDGILAHLLGAGANAKALDFEGNGALHHALQPPARPRVAVIDLLLKAGADPLLANKAGVTALSLVEPDSIPGEVRERVQSAAKKGEPATP